MSRQARLVRTRSGVVIGRRYVPNPPAQSRDADLIQSALIDPPLPVWERSLEAFNRNVGRGMLLVTVVAAVLGLAFK